MFPFSEVLPDIDSLLDAEGSSHYGLAEDKLPAANRAVRFIANMATRVEGANKFSEETLRDLTRVGIWECSTTYGRLHFNEAALGHEMLSIIAVMPDPDFPPGQVVVGTNFANDFLSRFRTDLSLWDYKHSAKRYTAEQRHQPRENLFMPGNNVLTDPKRIKYGYLNQSRYDSTTYTVTSPEIEVFPIPPAKATPSSGRYVAVRYIKMPANLSLVGSVIELPDTLKGLFVARTCWEMTPKQGDGTSLYGIMNEQVKNELILLGW